LNFPRAVAKEQGILTEVDAADNARLRRINKEEDWSWVLDDSKTNTSIVEGIKKEVEQGAMAAGRCNSSSKECGPHGVCLDNRCSCAVAYTGKITIIITNKKKIKLFITLNEV
jgi:hypothetical protein